MDFRSPGYSGFTPPFLLSDLRSCVRDRKALVIVGSGVSLAATKNPVAGWGGLLDSGIQRAVDLHLLAEEDERPWRRLLASGKADDLEALAERVTNALGGPGSGEFRRWIEDTVGALKVVDRSLLEALVGLGVPLATTNYDTLLEGRPAWIRSAGTSVTRSKSSSPGRLAASCISMASTHVRTHWC